MIKSLLYAFCLLILASSQMNAKVFPFDFTVKYLDNGLKVILIPMPKTGTVSYYTVVRTGSRDEWEPGRSGFAHFFEHMMFRGTEKRPGAVYDSIVTTIGADANAYTTDDFTCYHLAFTKADLETVIDLESDRFQNLRYAEPEFKTESGAVYGEFRKGRTSPFNVLWEKLKETAFDKHTYRHTTIGYEEDIKNMPNLYDYSLSFYKRYYRPENCIVYVVGDFEQEQTFELIKKYYSSWKKGYTAPQIEAEPSQKAPRNSEAKYDGKTNPILAIGYKGEAYNPKSKEVVASAMLYELAFGSNSELYKRLYLKEQKVLSLSSYTGMNRDPFLYLTYAMATEENLEYVKNEILAEIEKFKSTLVDANTLENLKKRNKYSYLMGMDSPKSVAGGLARFVAATGGIEQIEDYFTTMQEVTPKDIQNAAQRLKEEIRTTVTLRGDK